MIKRKNIILAILFSIYFIIGIYLSLTTGISHDQFHEQLNWTINYKAIQGIFLNNGNYNVLLDYSS